jgi:hypothetical protein
MKTVRFAQLVLVVWVSFCNATIIQTSNFNQIQLTLESADPETLVILDVDKILIVSTDQVLYPSYKPILKEKILHSPDGTRLWSIVERDRNTQLVDGTMPLLIQSLQKKGVLVVSLTAISIGSFGVIPSCIEWRKNQLNFHKIHLETPWKNHPRILFNLEGTGFEKGIIASASHRKGDVLEKFLNQSIVKIKKIIFVDDKLANVQSVEECARKKGLSFVGVYYTAIAERPHKILNEKRAQFQFEILRKEHVWLSDAEAEMRIKIHERQ